MNTVKTNFRPTILSQNIAAILLCGSLLAPAAHAARVDIPAGSLDHAIQLLAQQTGIVIAADGQQTRQFKAPAIRGDLSASQALQQLLRGSTLEAIQQKDGSYLLRPLTELPKVKVSATAPAESSGRTVAAGVNEAQLETVRVSAAANLGGSEATATSPVKGYVAKRSATATKTDTPIVETPQSISVVGAEEIKAIGATNIVEALAYTSGVVNSGGFDPSFESYVTRGFDQNGDVLRDGMLYKLGYGDSGFQDVYGLERIEFLKGAASVLYGQQSPGGVINTVSKRPQLDPINEIAIDYGNYNHKALKTDLSGKFSDNAFWRLTALTNDSESQVDHIGNKRIYIAPSLLWSISEKTNLYIAPFLQKGEQGHPRQAPYSGTIQPNQNGKISRNLFVGDPNIDGRNKYEIKGITTEITHEFSDQSKLQINHRSLSSEITVNTSGISSILPNQSQANYWTMRDVHNLDESHTADIRLNTNLNTGGIGHNILIGIDTTKQTVDAEGSRLWKSNAGIVDLFNSSTQSLPDMSNAYPMGTWRKQQIDSGLYLQDQIKIGDQWRILLGGRQSWIKQKDITENSTQSNQQFSANAGVVYLGSNGISPYASFSQSFQQEIGKLQDGSAMKPTEGEQFEAGIRWQPGGETGPLLSLATYQLTKTNVAKSDPANPDYSIQVGAIRSRGIELEAKGSFSKHVSGSIGYAYTDARTKRSTEPSEIGQRSGGVPLHQASAWLDVDGGVFNLGGLKLGAGVRYVGELPIEGETFTAPASTVVDARASYKYRNWRYDLNVTNLFDEVAYSGCAWGRCGFTKARTITGSVAYRF